MRRAAPMGAVCVDVPPLELSFVDISPWRSECTPSPYGQIQCNHLERQVKCDPSAKRRSHLTCLLTKADMLAVSAHTDQKLCYTASLKMRV